MPIIIFIPVNIASLIVKLIVLLMPRLSIDIMIKQKQGQLVWFTVTTKQVKKF